MASKMMEKKFKLCHGDIKPPDQVGIPHFFVLGQIKWFPRKTHKHRKIPTAPCSMAMNINVSIGKTTGCLVVNPASNAPKANAPKGNATANNATLIAGQTLSLFSTGISNLNTYRCTRRTSPAITRKTSSNTTARPSIGPPTEPRKT